MSTLQAQRKRLEKEMQEAQQQLEELNAMSYPNQAMVNYYTDVLKHYQNLMASIDKHLSATDSPSTGLSNAGE
ncbi:hypothetical protein OLMES_3842 [Oleiphilus messinensis]|uniref:Uncharacterized protein n=1 Tax=Oleiphilus messinensis TaxID=141451 RepID=A0A1Y0IBF6_9GAMM|nr:hypothetical protein [Oleiphilus messinensis]ARU57862.1 hypothetical protein OLMES_3842 [Oleiphilus messinensis]